MQSSLATGILSLRTTLAPLLLGVVAGPTQVGLFRIAQAPQTGLTAASSPVRLVLLTEQTRDWEHGREREVLGGVRRYMAAAARADGRSRVPVFLILMPWLVRIVFGPAYEGAVTAARIILLAAAMQLVLGWTKSLPVTIGRPRLRIVTHGIETAVLLPLVVVLRVHWGVTGAAVAMLVSTVAFAAPGRSCSCRLAWRGDERPPPDLEERRRAVKVLIVVRDLAARRRRPGESTRRSWLRSSRARGHAVEVVTTADSAPRAEAYPVSWVAAIWPPGMRHAGRWRGRAGAPGAPTSSTRRA